MTLVFKASKHLRETKVTGFSTVSMSALIYLGSFLWFAAMTGVDAVVLAMVKDAIIMSGLATLIILNVSMFTLQTINVLCCIFEFWPLTSLYWTCQLTAIGLISGSVGYAFSNEDDKYRIMLLSTARLFAQCLFTSSQFAVTLEYIYRSTTKNKTIQTQTQIACTRRPTLPLRKYIR